MEDITLHNNTFQDIDEDTISLRDLSINDHAANSPTARTSSAQELFEFFTGLSSESTRPSSTQNIIFCGKVIPDESSQHELNEYQKRDYLSLVRSASFRKLTHHDRVYNGLISDDRDRSATNDRSISGRFPAKTYSSPVQKVNITSLTSMSAKSRRRMFMFGPVKFKPEMELSAIRERQSRRAPAPMFPANAGAEAVTGGVAVRGKGHHWGLVRSLRCRAHLTTMLARSFGCISLTEKRGLALLS